MEKTKLKQILKELYNDQSKHSKYQNIPKFIQKEFGYQEKINEQWRGDTARYNYLLKEFNFANYQEIADIGANTGFFTLSLAYQFKNSHFTAYEHNNNHLMFIRYVLHYFELQNVTIYPSPVILKGRFALKRHDFCINFNVLHHAGVDFDQGLIEEPKHFASYGSEYLSKMSSKIDTMIFQMGYNWGGNKQKPIVGLQDDPGKLLYTIHLFQESGWKILKIAHAKLDPGQTIYYENMPQDLLARLISNKRIKNELNKYISALNLSRLSEFYRRPIFTCQSLKYNR
jgi:hypothetical protein